MKPADAHEVVNDQAPSEVDASELVAGPFNEIFRAAERGELGTPREILPGVYATQLFIRQLAERDPESATRIMGMARACAEERPADGRGVHVGL